jgi:hypothetical protein
MSNHTSMLRRPLFRLSPSQRRHLHLQTGFGTPGLTEAPTATHSGIQHTSSGLVSQVWKAPLWILQSPREPRGLSSLSSPAIDDDCVDLTNSSPHRSVHIQSFFSVERSVGMRRTDTKGRLPRALTMCGSVCNLRLFPVPPVFLCPATETVSDKAVPSCWSSHTLDTRRVSVAA